LLCQISGLRTVLGDQLPEPASAVLFDRKPDLQSAKPA